MSPVHGRKVVGDDAYDKAVREEVGGVHTFGVRVRGSIPENGPTNIAKRNTEHGPLVVGGSKFQDETGQESDGVSIESLRTILDENSTFFDSLYEAELARPDGARPDALNIFLEVERGKNGQGRADVLDEINTLLGAKRQTAAANADLIKARLEQSARQQAREADNVLLSDLPRLKKLAERQEALQIIKDAEGDDELTAISQNTATQVQAIGDELGLRLGDAGASGGPAGPSPISNATGGTGVADAKIVQNGPDDDEGDEPDPEVVRIRSMTIAQLEKEVKKQHIDRAAITGSGSGGDVLKKDLVTAILTKMGKPTEE